MVVPGTAPIPTLEITTRVRVFVVPVTFTLVVNMFEATFRVVTLVVERFEVAVALRVDAKRLVTFMIAAFPLVKTFRVAMFARV